MYRRVLLEWWHKKVLNLFSIQSHHSKICSLMLTLRIRTKQHLSNLSMFFTKACLAWADSIGILSACINPILALLLFLFCFIDGRDHDKLLCQVSFSILQLMPMTESMWKLQHYEGDSNPAPSAPSERIIHDAKASQFINSYQRHA